MKQQNSKQHCAPISYPLIVLQLHEMKVPIYPRYGTIFCSRSKIGWTGGGNKEIGIWVNSQVKAAVIVAARLVASSCS